MSTTDAPTDPGPLFPTRPAPAEAAPHATTLCEAFQATAARDPDAVAVRDHEGAVTITWRQYAQRVRSLAAGLAALGVGRGDTVALYLSNRPEFHLIDTAAIHVGAIPFSVYVTSAREQAAYVLDNAGCRVVVTEAQHLDEVRAACSDGEPRTLVCIDASAPDVITLGQLEAGGSPDFAFDSAWRAVEPSDVLTLIYTSGTTGPPKGVQITHAGMLAQCRAVGQVLPFRPGARVTSYLPSAHIADRWSAHYTQMVWGTQTTCVADARAIAQVLPALRPTIWGGVPRVVEKLKVSLEAFLDAEPDPGKREAVRAAVATGVERARLRSAREDLPAELEQRYQQADAAVLSRIRAAIGLDQAEWVLIGAAALSTDVQEFLLGIGLPLIELYGMSEASCCVSATHPDQARIGSVGPAIPGLQTRLAPDGELLLRGPTVTVGYRGDEQRTREALDEDGWLRTGDIVEIDDDGYLRIVDRKKELIINASGKNMSPSTIEGHLRNSSPLIDVAVAVGDRRPYNVALLVLSPEAPAYAAEHGRAALAVELDAAVARANARLSRVEQIKRYAVIDDEWPPGGDELTPTLKLRRQPIAQRYAGLIDDLYAGR